MFALFARSCKLTLSGPARLYPLYRPCLQNSAVDALTRFYSNGGVDRIDEATLKDFKRVLALRQELKRCGALEILKAQLLYSQRPLREAVNNERVVEKPWPAIRVVMNYLKSLHEMCNTEYRKQARQLPPEAPGFAKALHRRDLGTGPVSYSELLPIISRFEALLEADAAQQRPLLNSQERGTLADVLKEYLSWQKREERNIGVIVPVAVAALVWIYLWPEDSSSNGNREGHTVTQKDMPR